MAPVSVYPFYTMWPHGYSTRLRQHPSGLHHLWSVYHQDAPSFFWNRKKSDGARNCSRSKAYVCWQYADVQCRAIEQFQARACLFDKITSDHVGLQKTNNISHLTVGWILNRHSHGHSYLWTYHVTRSDVELHETAFQHHTEHQKPIIGCNKTGVQTVCANVLYFLDGLRKLMWFLKVRSAKEKSSDIHRDSLISPV